MEKPRRGEPAPLIDLETGELLDRYLVTTLDRLEKDADDRVVVVDLKTAARKSGDLQAHAKRRPGYWLKHLDIRWLEHHDVTDADHPDAR
jgi:hypothetical protein